MQFLFRSLDGNVGNTMLISPTTEMARLGRQGIIITPENSPESTLIKFSTESGDFSLTVALDFTVAHVNSVQHNNDDKA